MNYRIQTYLDNLFKDYNETAELKDFKEEITSNLIERIYDLEQSGMNLEDAFNKAIAELGDITAIADDISKQKRNEVIGNMYFNKSPKLSKIHAIGYAVSSGIFIFGIIVALITISATGILYQGIAALMPFLVLSGATFVYLGLTQETKRNYPMSKQRALVYAIAAGSVLFGLNTSTMQYFLDKDSWEATLGTLIPFVIPAGGVLVFLLLTEKKRHKPWVIEEQKLIIEQYTKKYNQNPDLATKRGLLSAILWIIAFGLFVFIWMTFSLKYAFLVFIFAIAGELLIELWTRSKIIKL